MMKPGRRYQGRRIARQRRQPVAAVRTGARGRGEEKRGNGTPSKRPAEKLWQLVLSAAILISVIAAKLLAPQLLEQVRTPLLTLIGGSTDMVEVFAAAGRALDRESVLGDMITDAYTAVFGSSTAIEETDMRTNTVYSGTSTPENVWLLQKELGFAYTDPIKGTLSDLFGYRIHPIEGNEQFHYGLDIEADEGTVIGSFAKGTVKAVGESSALGQYVTIAHENGYTTLYAHCRCITASTGQQVQPGDPIAEVGQTGLATGPHLHFELMLENNYLNPIYYYGEA